MTKLTMFKLLFVLMITQALAFAGPYEEAMDILDHYASENSLPTRMEIISRSFLGLPYGEGGPLGEGENGRFDQDPLYRFDTFDCTTFVETITALALAKDVTQFEFHLNSIRYEFGDIEYLKRNHFTDLQWIPYNIQNGYLKEINNEIAPNFIKMASAKIDFPNWLRFTKVSDLRVPSATQAEKEALVEELRENARYYSVQTATVPYLEINWLVAHPQELEKIPSGTIVNFVRPNWDLTDIIGTHQNISHQGFLFRLGKERTLYLRHASSSGEKKVTQVPFLDYLTKFVDHPTLKGIHLMGVAYH